MDGPGSDTYIGAFNDLLQSFLSELSAVFPEEKAIRTFAAGFPGLVAVSKRKALDLFIEAIGDHIPLIIKRDAAVFEELDAWGIDFKKLWHSDISEGTRMAIWDYMHALVEYASRVDPKVRALLVMHEPAKMNDIEKQLTTMAMECTKKIESGEVDMSSLMDAVFAKAPPELVQNIESLAAECAEKMQAGSMDMDAMMGTVMDKLKDMDLSALESADPTELTHALGGLGLDAGMLSKMTSLAMMSSDDGTDDLLKMLDDAKPAKKKKSGKQSKK